MERLTKITLRGKYTGVNSRGIIVGGTLMLPNMPATLVNVTEETFDFLKKGAENGWFKIEKDNYEQFCISRGRIDYTSPSEPEKPSPEQPTEEQESVKEVEAEEIKAEEKKSKKTSKKKELDK